MVEEVLKNSVIGVLEKTVTGVDPRHAFDFLMWWLLTSSEAQLRIDRNKAIYKLERIGKFLSQRAAYHDEWHTSIVPICASSDRTCDASSLAKEFYRGGRVRFDHITSDLDVPRDRFLKEIHTAFSRTNVVVVHSASGQGKTTLAYRYAKEFAPSEFRLEVLSSANLKHARRIALALVGHADAVEVPTLVYLDVRPGDSYWSEVVRELASVVGIRVLVTIREEDWTRARISAADFSYSEVQLSFEKDEAEPIYARLTEGATRSRHLDFDDAWSQFGRRKTLFEFVYYITQEESLSDRISSQVDALQDAVIRGERSTAEMEFLLLVAVASAYEARVNLKSLLDFCDLAAPQRTIERFSDEYLIRVSEDGSHLEGFHSIRSEIVSQKLTDSVVCPWSDAACRVLPLIVEDDLQSFLLCAFSRKAVASKPLAAALSTYSPKTWVGVHGIFSSLMWNGLKDYTERNAALLDEVFENVKTGWSATLDWDLGQVFGKDGLQVFERLEHISPEAGKAAEYARSAKARQFDKDQVFSEVRRWLAGFTETPVCPEDIRNFNAMGEVAFWLGHLEVESPLRMTISISVLDSARKELPIYSFGEFVRGIRTCQPDVYDEWLETHRSDLVEYLRREAAIVVWDESAEGLVAHYAIDLDRQSSALRTRGDASPVAEATIHDLTIERVELLSNLFSGKKRYGAVGYGHRMSLITQLWDDADKPGVLAENLHPIWPRRFNSLARGYADRRFRPESWVEYFRTLQSSREMVLAAFDDLRQAIPSLTKKETTGGAQFINDAERWDECRRDLNGELLLPKVAVDEWGFITESSLGNAKDSRTERYSGLHRFASVRKAVSEYRRTIGNFMSQALHSLVLVPRLRTEDSQAAKNRFATMAAHFGINERSIRLSVNNGIDACASVHELQKATQTIFRNENSSDPNLDFCKRERDEFYSTFTAWCKFINDGMRKGRVSNAKKKSRHGNAKSQKATSLGDFLIHARNRLKNSLQALRKEDIKAEILSEIVPWNGMSALWISFDTDHPITSLKAIERLWYQLIDAFEPDRDKIVSVKVSELLWSEIVLVPLVGGKCLERQAMPHFNAVRYANASDLEQSSWRLFPEPISDDIWSQLDLNQWEAQPGWSHFDNFAAAYGLLFFHVDHMSDFGRLSGELDEIGVSLLQSYLDHETSRAQPLLQKLFDAFADVLNRLPEIDDDIIQNRPNICLCMQVLVEMKGAVMPTPDFHEHAKLSINEVVGWRERLFAGMQRLGIARYLWMADSLKFGACPNLS